ncbi:MAG: hypothetical protein O3A63_11310 [Proteobacteria bacterium]|nr:hypothetical protein [Pseudomonadota bacterium]
MTKRHASPQTSPQTIDLRPVNTHKHYHAHIYFDGRSLGLARDLCQSAKSGETHVPQV